MATAAQVTEIFKKEAAFDANNSKIEITIFVNLNVHVEVFHSSGGRQFISFRVPNFNRIVESEKGGNHVVVGAICSELIFTLMQQFKYIHGVEIAEFVKDLNLESHMDWTAWLPMYESANRLPHPNLAKTISPDAHEMVG